MRRLVLLLLCAAAFLAAAAPRRVVSQAVGTDDLLLEVADPGQIAALSHLGHDARYAPSVARARRFPVLRSSSAEEILRQRPDLVLSTPYAPPESLVLLRRAGVKVHVFERFERLEDVYANLRTLGALLGHPERAEAVVRASEAAVRELARRLQGVRPIRVLAAGLYPFASGSGTSFQDICDHAGALNVAAEAGLAGHVPMPGERALAWRVEVLIGPRSRPGPGRPAAGDQPLPLHAGPEAGARGADPQRAAGRHQPPPRGDLRLGGPGPAPGALPVKARAGGLTAAMALLLVLAVLLSLALGDALLPLRELLPALAGRGDALARTVLWDIRLPRTLVGLAVGAALGASGTVMQAYFRNPLASPGLLGVSSGGALGAVAVLALGLGHLGLFALPVASIAGAFLATGAVMLLARKGASVEHLLLAGVALNALFGAATSFLVTVSATDAHASARVIFWLMGGIEHRTWEHVAMALPDILVGCALLLPLGRAMNLLALGEDGAQSLGVDVRRLRLRLVVLSTVLTALATAVAGVVGFVGLVVPHLVRLALGPDHRRLLPLSMLGGAAMVLLCDLPTRFLGVGMRLGVVTALVGGPFLLGLLRRRPC